MAVESHKAYIAVIFIMLVYAGNALISKLAMSKGIKPSVFVAYRQALASLTLAPFAYFFERKAPALSFKLLAKIFLVSLCGITAPLELYYEGINYTSATFAAAFTNALPALTFVLAILFRMESVSLTQVHGLAKVLGTLLGLSGAIMFAFVKGPPLSLMNWNQQSNGVSVSGSSSMNSSSNGEWVKGSLMMLGSNVTWSLWLILQGPVVKEYPAILRLTVVQCFFGWIQSSLYAIAIDRNLSCWKLGWDFSLFSVAYCGVVVTGMTYWLQVWVVKKKGPVFAASFTPLSLVLTAIISAFLWKETLFWGRIGGATLLVVGLYVVLWGKSTELHIQTAALEQDDATLEHIPI
ncbi:hypothetical protein V2J09_008772 [Rumex salicifolius]